MRPASRAGLETSVHQIIPLILPVLLPIPVVATGGRVAPAYVWTVFSPSHVYWCLETVSTLALVVILSGERIGFQFKSTFIFLSRHKAM